MLTQRIGKSANEFLTTEGVSPEAVFLLGKDLNSFREITKGLLDGNPQMRLPGTRDPQTRERLTALIKQYQETAHAGRLDPRQPAGPERGARGAGVDHRRQRAAAQGPRDGAGPARQRDRLQRRRRCSCCCCSAAARRRSAAPGFLRLYVREQGQRAALAQSAAPRGRGARSRKPSASTTPTRRRFLRLMNELQGVAEGDLTQQATVTEDITGAIADSVNYTVEELRTLVSQVQGTVGRVTDDDRAGRGQLDRAARDLVRAAARDPRHRRVGAADGRPDQQRVDAGAGNRRRSRASRCRRPSRACRRCRTRSAA